MQQHGFVKPAGAGVATRGWVHPTLRLGFEVVASTVLDGLADRDRTLTIDFAPDGQIALIAIEDIIADRMGQFASGAATDMRDQARQLFLLFGDADFAYMDRRIREETDGDYGIEDLKN